MRINWPQAHNNACVEIGLNPGQTIVARPESVMATNGPVKMSPNLGDPDFSRYQAHAQPITLWLTPSFAGCLQDIALEADGLKVRRAHLITYSDQVTSRADWPGFKTPEDALPDWLTLSGEGLALVSGFGSLYPVQIDGKCLINPNKIVAMQGRVNYTEDRAHPTRWQRLTGMRTLSCCFYGAGTLWCQSHQPLRLTEQLTPRLHSRRIYAGRYS